MSMRDLKKWHVLLVLILTCSAGSYILMAENGTETYHHGAAIVQSTLAKPTDIPTATAPSPMPTIAPSPTPTPWAYIPPVTPVPSPTSSFVLWPPEVLDYLPEPASLSDSELDKIEDILSANDTGLIFAFHNWREPRTIYYDTVAYPVQVSEETIGIMDYAAVPTGGSGILPYITQKLYLIQDGRLREVWQWKHFGGYRAGLTLESWQALYPRFAFLTGKAQADILLEKQGLALNYDGPSKYFPRSYNYRVFFPGGLVFSMIGERYELSYYYNGATLIPIHSTQQVAIVPYVHYPLVMDGQRNDWYQTEYTLATSTQWDKVENDSRTWVVYPSRASLAWDDDYLYISALIPLSETFQIGLDVDLVGDINVPLRDADDFVFEITAPQDPMCAEAVTVRQMGPLNKVHYTKGSTLVVGSIPGGQDNCRIEIAFSKDDLHLKGDLVSSHGNVLQYMDEFNVKRNEYHLAAGKVIGGAFQLKSENIFDMDNPTTWGTLIFVSDE